MLDFYGIQNVRIEHIRGKLNDHYDPRDNVIRLSDGVYGSCSVAAIGIACHEAGHAAQHAENYTPIKVRNALLMPCQIGSRAAIPLAVIGIFFRLTAACEYRDFLLCLCNAVPACNASR